MPVSIPIALNGPDDEPYIPGHNGHGRVSPKNWGASNLESVEFSEDYPSPRILPYLWPRFLFPLPQGQSQPLMARATYGGSRSPFPDYPLRYQMSDQLLAPKLRSGWTTGFSKMVSRDTNQTSGFQ